jgi:hypothetical protein
MSNKALGTDASTTIPGSIFPDDIASPDADNTPLPTVSGSGGITQIEVNQTTKIVLISLGIAVGAMFFLGVVATYYISHKNKRACLKKQEQDAAATSAATAETGDLESGHGSSRRGKEKAQEQDSEVTTMTTSLGEGGGQEGRELHNKWAISNHIVLRDNGNRINASWIFHAATEPHLCLYPTTKRSERSLT